MFLKSKSTTLEELILSMEKLLLIWVFYGNFVRSIGKRDVEQSLNKSY